MKLSEYPLHLHTCEECLEEFACWCEAYDDKQEIYCPACAEEKEL